MKKIRLLYIFMGLTMLASRLSSAQNSFQQRLNNLSPLSPTASGIATYVDYPVDYKTGVPNITIPLFEVQTKTGTIPFSLSYHVGKVKSSEFTGPVGLGWSLMPEMGITRSKRGLTDDLPQGYTVPAISTCNDKINLAQGTWNSEPDDFYYSLLSKQGKFLYNKTNTFSTIPFEALKISRPDKYSFSISDNDGTLYQFGKDTQGNQKIETSTHPAGEYETLDSWKITEIKSFDGTETIRFFYNAPVTRKIRNYLSQYKILHNKCPGLDPCPDFIKETMFNGTYYQVNDMAGWKYMKPAYSALPQPDYNFSNYNDIAPYSTNNGFDLVDYPTPLYSQPTNQPVQPLVQTANPEMDGTVIQEHLINELPLKEIIFNNGKVTYEYTDNKLTRLSLYNQINGVYQLLKYVVFTYSDLLKDNYDDIPNYNMDRYTLDFVNVYDSGNKVINNYKLEYTTRSLSNIPLAMNAACDIWGFPYQGYLNSMPKMKVALKVRSSGPTLHSLMNVNIGKQDFETVLNGVAIPFPPLLKKIIYPTRGSAEFTFERNQFKNMLGASGIGLRAGGFRISKISYITDQNTAKTKVYKYGIDESGYGEIKYFPNKGDFMYDQVFKNAAGNSYIETTIFSTPFTSLSFSGGAAVLYPEVTEYEAILNTEGNIADYNGKIKYEYFISGIGNARVQYTPLCADYRDEWNRSYLKKKTILNRNNNIIMNETYKYTTFSIDNIPVHQAFQRYFTQYNNEDVCQSNILTGGYTILGSSNSAVDYFQYNIPVGISLLTEKTISSIDKWNYSVMESQTYTYDPDNFFLKSTSTTIDETTKLRTTNYYPKDLIANSLMSNLVQANRISSPIKIEQFNNDDKISEIITSYAQNITTKNILLPQAVYTNKGIAAIDMNLDKKLTYDQYDDKGNILQYTLENRIPVSIIWGYNKTVPIAKIENATNAQIAATLGIDVNNLNETNLTAINTLRSNSVFTNAMITTYTHIPLVGVESITDPKGDSITYKYDNFGRLEFIKDKNGNILSANQYNYK